MLCDECFFRKASADFFSFQRMYVLQLLEAGNVFLCSESHTHSSGLAHLLQLYSLSYNDQIPFLFVCILL